MPKGGVARAVQRESVAGDSGARTGLLVQLKEGAGHHIPTPLKSHAQLRTRTGGVQHIRMG